MSGAASRSGETAQSVVVVPTGMLGAGVSAEQVRRAVTSGAHAIAVDSGSTDSGPAYLARAMSKMNRDAIKSDLAILMLAAHHAAIPLLVGSCGTSGADAGVDWTAEIAEEVARELAIRPKIALLYSEQSQDCIATRCAAGRVRPLPPSGPLSEKTIRRCEHIVALMGPEPYIRAIESGADIVLGGRTTDTAVLAAVPLMRGAGAGAAWHAAKVAECGGQCTVNPRSGGVVIRVGQRAFDIEPMGSANACTPETVSAHMLYETSDPFQLTEPGGVLDVSAARYVQSDARVTRVTGSVWRPAPYTMKLEGAAAAGWQTIMLIGIADPLVLANLDEFHDALQASLVARIRQTFRAEAGAFELSLRIYGWNAVSGVSPPPGTPPPCEVGVLFVVTAASQDLADRMAKACNPYFFHFPLRPGMELPSYAFPFTPAEISRGQVFEFLLNHIVEVDDPLDLVRTRWIDLAREGGAAPIHG